MQKENAIKRRSGCRKCLVAWSRKAFLSQGPKVIIGDDGPKVITDLNIGVSICVRDMSPSKYVFGPRRPL